VSRAETIALTRALLASASPGARAYLLGRLAALEGRPL
jgi:hypothetical protein